MATQLTASVIGLISHVAAAQPLAIPALPASESCLPGIAAAEKHYALPRKLLFTIGVVESGRPDPVTGRVTPWPWTIDVNGTGYMFPTKAAAIQAVQTLQAAGVRSVDVGCMQVNLMHHPDAFASLDEAFDPSANTQYGAHFLSALYRETGNWPRAAAEYHSRTEDIGVAYETRVMAIWPLAQQYPDATLAQRQHASSPGAAPPPPRIDTTGFTPEFAARVQGMEADYARLEARFGPPLNAQGQPAAPTASHTSHRVPAAQRRGRTKLMLTASIGGN
jgi:hypothetical protein